MSGEAETAKYVAMMARQLAKISSGAGMKLTAYSLEVAAAAADEEAATARLFVGHQRPAKLA